MTCHMSSVALRRCTSGWSSQSTRPPSCDREAMKVTEGDHTPDGLPRKRHGHETWGLLLALSLPGVYNALHNLIPDDMRAVTRYGRDHVVYQLTAWGENRSSFLAATVKG